MVFQGRKGCRTIPEVRYDTGQVFNRPAALAAARPSPVFRLVMSMVWCMKRVLHSDSLTWKTCCL